MISNNLHIAKKKKNDDFYTKRETIEDELRHYKHHFKDKVVFCNCDDPEESQFWKYFFENFKHLGLKKLVSTHYKGGGVDFWLNNEPHPYKKEIIDGIEQPKVYLKNDGDFRSSECIEILKESDIVVTNPPFSLFREYVAQLMEYNKKFLIIGNMNAITYKEIFPLIKENKIWLGVSPRGITFNTPNGEKTTNAVWFTNLDIKKRHEDLPLGKTYNPKDYPKYDNYDAIEVSKTIDIPKDYDGVMGVPITFLDKYNPDQFEILGCTANPESNSVEKKKRSSRVLRLIKEGRLKGAKCVGGNSNIYIDSEDYVHVLYHRILIKNKKVEK